MKKPVKRTVKGVVYLVGAGPGAEDLLTLKGQRILSRADAVLYDELVNPAILKHAPTGCRFYFVGKIAGSCSHSDQKKINRLLVQLAKRHKTIARLKGGDPLLFGRGAEEACYLKGHQIPFEFVPGVSSPFGCAAYSGIPLTERTLSSRVLILSGHNAATGTGRNTDWRAAREAADTLVVLMGVARLDTITRQMLDAGWPGATPAALVQWGTWPIQKVVEAPLKAIAAAARKNAIGSPAVFFAGPTLRLRKALRWFENRPLFGRKVYYTRPVESSAELRDLLTEAGAQVVDTPLIRIENPISFEPFDRWVTGGGRPDWLIFTSANGVKAFFERLKTRHHLDARRLHGTRIASIGQATAAALALCGIRADFVPKKQTAKGLASEFLSKHPAARGKHLLLIRPKNSPASLRATLARTGARITQLSVYETRPVSQEDFRSAWSFQPPVKGDALLFASSSMVRAFFKVLGSREARESLKRLSVISIGPETSRTLREFGALAFREAATPSASDLLKEILPP